MSEPIRLAVGAPRRARGFVRHALADWSLSDHLGDVEWCVSELVTNALFFGTEPASITVSWNDPLLRVDVADSGPGEPCKGTLVDRRRTSGRGLAIVDAVADGWGVRSQEPAGKVVWFGLIVEP